MRSASLGPAEGRAVDSGMSPHFSAAARGLEPASTRDYAPIAAALRELPPETDRQARMQAVVDLIWEAFGRREPAETEIEGLDRHGEGAVSWVGFYLPVPDKDEMVLGPRRDKPACSPIGMHGACGRALRTRKTLVIPDVSRLGEGYIACDPRDRSELVVPCLEKSGECWGVLDLDSHDSAAFYERDGYALMLVLRAAGLSHADAEVELL